MTERRHHTAGKGWGCTCSKPPQENGRKEAEIEYMDKDLAPRRAK